MSDKVAKSEIRMFPEMEAGSRYMLGQARNIYDTSGGLPSTYVGMDPYRLAGVREQARLGAGPDVATMTALPEWQKTISGGYLGSNPFLDAIVQRAAGAAQRGPISEYAAANRTASGGFANAMLDARSRVAERLYGADYDQERGRMLAALAYAPQMQLMPYFGAAQLQSAGAAMEADEAARRQEEMRQFEWPYERLARLERSYATSPMNRVRQTKNWEPFDWGQAIAQGVSGMLSPPSLIG